MTIKHNQQTYVSKTCSMVSVKQVVFTLMFLTKQNIGIWSKKDTHKKVTFFNASDIYLSFTNT